MVESLSLQTIPVADRAGLVYDAISLPLYGFLSYDTALSFLTCMTNETHYVPWKSIHSGLNTLQGRVTNKTLWNVSIVHRLPISRLDQVGSSLSAFELLSSTDKRV